MEKQKEYEINMITSDYVEITNKTGEKTYLVDLILKTCTCPAFFYNKNKKCKHLKMCEGMR